MPRRSAAAVLATAMPVAGCGSDTGSGASPTPADATTRATDPGTGPSLDDPANQCVLVDVRSPAADTEGHHPGAVNLDWAQTVGADGRFLPTDELRELHASAGITPDGPVVSYCDIGVRAAHTWFVLHELLGNPDVALYDGSWSEYGTTKGVEIET